MRRRTCWCTATPSGRSCEIAHRLAAGRDDRRASPICAARRSRARRCPTAGSRSTRRTSMRPGRSNPPLDPYAMASQRAPQATGAAEPRRRAMPPPRPRRWCKFVRRVKNAERERSVIRMPSLRAGERPIRCCTRTPRASCISESNPGNARALVQRHGDLDVWLNPPPIPLTHRRRWTAVYELPYRARAASVLRRRRASPPTR